MAASVGIIICNYNRKEYILPCIESIFESTYKDIEIYVVDNASTDGSVASIRETYGKRINLLENELNLGGAGGFNRGLKEALKKDHRFLLLLDNDVKLEMNTITRLLNTMQSDETIAVAGAAIYKMDEPRKTQEIGANIDWELFTVDPLYKNLTDPKALPEMIECDYVPACCALVRVEAISKVGLIDDRLYIHWDDIEWFYKFKLHGYKVIALSNAIVWHKGGNGFYSNTFPNYYLLRNGVRFFAKYSSPEKLPDLAEMMINSWFKATYFGGAKGINSVAQTIYMACEDVLNGTFGKANENRIFDREKIKKDLLENRFKNNSKIVIVSDLNGNLYNFEKYIEPLNLEINTIYRLNNREFIEPFISKIKRKYDSDTMVIYFSTHILETPEEVTDILVIDEYLNVADLTKNNDTIRHLKQLMEQMISTMRPLYVSRLHSLRQTLLAENQIIK